MITTGFEPEEYVDPSFERHAGLDFGLKTVVRQATQFLSNGQDRRLLCVRPFVVRGRRNVNINPL